MAFIRRIEISNFKSIKRLILECKRINIFIGEPNVGKSNILEALGLVSFLAHGGVFKEYVRYENFSDLFYDGNFEEPIKISLKTVGKGRRGCKETCYTIKGTVSQNAFRVFVSEGKRKKKEDKSTKETLLISPVKPSTLGIVESMVYYLLSESERVRIPKLSAYSVHLRPERRLEFIKFYRFREEERTNVIKKESKYLIPPSGENLPTILSKNTSLRLLSTSLLKRYDFKLVIEAGRNKIVLQRELGNGLVFSLPYISLSDTLRRIIFHLAAIETNEDSTLIFEEPEAHSFPYYTKLLAEKIAKDTHNNQYFISTHNPYFLLSVVEKSKKEDIAVFITSIEDRQTKLKRISGNELSKILDHDVNVFFNLDDLERLGGDNNEANQV